MVVDDVVEEVKEAQEEHKDAQEAEQLVLINDGGDYQSLKDFFIDLS